MTFDHESSQAGGFDLRSVSWGYQQLFADAIDRLAADGTLGRGGEEGRRVFFDMLHRATPGSFDHVVKEFLVALNPRTRWMVAVPAIFEDLVELGVQISRSRLAHGIAFFRHWGKGAFGDTPEQVRALLHHVRALREVDAELAQAFLGSYPRLLDRLSLPQVQLFANWVRDLYPRNRRTAIESAALRLQAALTFVENLSHESRLDDVRDRLARLARAMVGRTVEIADFSQLDSDHLILRGSKVVSFQDAVYLPVKMLVHERKDHNEALFLLAVLASAAAVRWDSFTALQGERGRGAETIEQYLGGDRAWAAAVTVVETVRVLDTLAREMPGSRSLIRLGIETEFTLQPPRSRLDSLLHDVLRNAFTPGPWQDSPQRSQRPQREEEEVSPPQSSASSASSAVQRGPDTVADLRDGVRTVRDIASRSRSVDDTADLVRPLLRQLAPFLDAEPRATIFLPDFHYPAELSEAPPSVLVADASRRPRPDEPAEPSESADTAPDAQQGKPDESEGVRAGFVYPEWNHAQNDYYEDWCLLREHRAPVPPGRPRPPDPAEDAAVARARRMFQRLKPDTMRKEKSLPFGDEINVDRLVEYLARRREGADARVDFYEKKYIRRRDLAVALLLDVSGSTANDPQGQSPPSGEGGPRILDIEKRAGLILGEGLSALGDAFAIWGFSGNGREHCDFFVYKGLDEPFGPDQRTRLHAAFPSASTRIGVALRHARTLLDGHPARRKILLLITDGKPQDSDYDPATRYAQYDVRMAVQECHRQDIHVVCISTLENSRADLEIMFPHRRFVILEDMRKLVDLLPQLYLRMTC